MLTEAGIRISMDGKGRWMDNVFIERLWRSLKYECVYLSELGPEALSELVIDADLPLSSWRSSAAT